MSDRVYLERTEASEMLFNYDLKCLEQGKIAARKWLETRISKLAGIYGFGFSARIRAYMRELDDAKVAEFTPVEIVEVAV